MLTIAVSYESGILPRAQQARQDNASPDSGSVCDKISRCPRFIPSCTLWSTTFAERGGSDRDEAHHGSKDVGIRPHESGTDSGRTRAHVHVSNLPQLI